MFCSVMALLALASPLPFGSAPMEADAAGNVAAVDAVLSLLFAADSAMATFLAAASAVEDSTGTDAIDVMQ